MRCPTNQLATGQHLPQSIFAGIVEPVEPQRWHERDGRPVQNFDRRRWHVAPYSLEKPRPAEFPCEGRVKLLTKELWLVEALFDDGLKHFFRVETSPMVRRHGTQGTPERDPILLVIGLKSIGRFEKVTPSLLTGRCFGDQPQLGNTLQITLLFVGRRHKSPVRQGPIWSPDHIPVRKESAQVA